MKELINLAKEKGFESGFQKLPYCVGKNDQYIYLCELKKWLMDEHNMFVQVHPMAEDSRYGRYLLYRIFLLKNGCRELLESNSVVCKNEEFPQALKEGLKKALTLI